jgi:NAD(P) transhydrogenase subunit alpha
MIVGVCKETDPGERRVALVPTVVPSLTKKGLEVLVESGAGLPAGFRDGDYEGKGVKLASGRDAVFSRAQVVLQVRGLGASPETGRADMALFKADHVVIGLLDPLSNPEAAQALAGTGVSAFSLDLLPRITRAQSMDVLSSQATVAGYKAVLIATEHVPRMFPMLMTAAGTVAPAHVLVIGAGVAGLQAIATAKRLGAVVHAYDIRPAVKQQIESLGAKFVELPIEAGGAEDKGGYAKAMDEEFYRKQRELMGKVVAESDVVITTAAVPGKKAPVLVTGDMVQGMPAGSVIVDLAAERGGNCELTRPGETIREGEVTIVGPLNVPSMVPYHASQMYAKNISTFLLHLLKDGAVQYDLDDEITRETLVAREGRVVQPRVRELLGMEPVDSPGAPQAPAASEKATDDTAADAGKKE